MYPSKKMARLGAVGLAAALILSACGEDDGGGDEPGGTDTSATAAPKGDGTLTFGTLLPPPYLALYDMNNQTEAGLKGFIDKVKRKMATF